MMKLEGEELEQTKLKEYLLGLKEKLLAAQKKKQSEEADHLLYNQRIHHFADQFLRSQGQQIPLINLYVDKFLIDDFISTTNGNFRNKYSKLWAYMLHEEKRIGLGKRN